MTALPSINDPDDPLVSILICNYEGRHLRRCLDAVFAQTVLKNIEIILVDDATEDGSWDVALAYADAHPGMMTVSRNRRSLGPKANLAEATRMAHGRYCAHLVHDALFRPDYVAACARQLAADPQVSFDTVRRHPKVRLPSPSVEKGPLVSVLCYNYNYGRYLRECLESVFAQTYRNIELCFSDNASSDESWAIAVEYARQHPHRMRLTRNRLNFGPDYNFANCRRTSRGKYFVNFCSDDVLEPTFVERCVAVLEAHPRVGMVIVNRAMIDEHGRRTDEAPFYNQSCVIPGDGQAGVYMMAGVNPSVSQVMYRNRVVDGLSSPGALVARYYGTRILDFNVSMRFDVGYIKDALLRHRIHGQSDTAHADANLMPVIGLYVLNHQLAEIASLRGFQAVADRLPASIEKLARLAIRYSVRSVIGGQVEAATRYFHLAAALDARVTADETWRALDEYSTASAARREEIVESFRRTKDLAARTVSYDPPAGSTPLPD